tara:strand:+ start:896 stop:2911 length:2016 start_codon:yes stop_codon:yes gene_type:complete
MTKSDRVKKEKKDKVSHTGLVALKQAILTLPTCPGVYRMLNKNGKVLYVGKARNLKRRVASYTNLSNLTLRLQKMVVQTTKLEVITTHTEAEALLLESNLIKRLTPRYNVLLRDDKSFPYILLTSKLNGKTLRTGAPSGNKINRTKVKKNSSLSKSMINPNDWIGITKYRGAKTIKGEYYGPFASAGAVNRTLNSLERAFLLRSCSDSVFSGRSRACLKYQLKRCSAPCVGHISAEDYTKLVKQARIFLGGQSRAVQESIAEEMYAASKNLEFEAAGRARDRIHALTQIQSHQDINVEDIRLPEADIIAAWKTAGQTCIQVFFYRGGRNYGNHAYFPRHDKFLGVEEVLTAFIGQFYEDKSPPRLLLLSHKPIDEDLLSLALSVRAKQKVKISVPLRGYRRKLLHHALDNAKEALKRKLAETATNQELIKKTAKLFNVTIPLKRIEVYDNSHVGGQHAIGAMIVAGSEGFIKTAYRKFNMRGHIKGNDLNYSPGDDYGMMNEMLSRRFSRAIKEDPEKISGQWPQLLLIDGGLGQLKAATAVLDRLNIKDITIAAIAKGPDRNAGQEKFFTNDKKPFYLTNDDSLLYYLQRLRDEAHRFAIGSHRSKRSKAISKNPLDDINGIGAKRKKALLNHFGSARSVARAGLLDLEEVDGISTAVAHIVYNHFNTNA